MNANTSLYLADLPQPVENRDKKRVVLNPVISTGSAKNSDSGHASQEDVALALAAMTQTLLEDMQKLLKFLSQETEQNAEAGQMNVTAANYQANQASEALKQYNEAHSFWHQFLGVFLKVIGPILALASLALAIFIGPGAFVIAAAILLLTVIPVHNGQGILQTAVSAAVGAIGQACGWSQDTITLVEGIVNLVIGIALGIASGNAATAIDSAVAVSADVAETVGETVATVADDVATTVPDEVEMTTIDASETTDDLVQTATKAEDTAAKAAKYSANVTKVVRITTGTALVGSSNCFSDIFLGSYMLANPNADRQKAEEIAMIVGLVANLAMIIGSLGASWNAMSSLAEDAGEMSATPKLAARLFGEGSTLQKLLGNVSTTIVNVLKNMSETSMAQLQTLFQKLTRVLQSIEYGAGVVNGWENHVAADYQADFTKYTGEANFSLGVAAILNQMTTLVNNSEKDMLKRFDALERTPNYSQGLFTEAQALQA